MVIEMTSFLDEMISPLDQPLLYLPLAGDGDLILIAKISHMTISRYANAIFDLGQEKKSY